MTARERMAVAMAKGAPDRPPLMCQLALGHYFLHTDLDAVDIWHDTEAYAQALVTLQRRYGFDGILVNLPGRNPEWRRQVREVTTDEHGIRTVTWSDGSVTIAPPDDNPHVRPPSAGTAHVPLDRIDPEALFYVEPHDPAGVTYPCSWGFGGDRAPVGGPAFFPPYQCDTLRRVREIAGAEVSVHAEVFSPFTQLMELVGYADGLMALALEQGKCLAILDRLAEGTTCLAELYAGEDVDAILISSAFVGAGFISRGYYEAFEMPFLRRIVAGVRAVRGDLPVYVHTCGAIGDRLDLMEATGIDGIDTLDPPPLGTVELKDALHVLGKRVFIKGNVDPVHEVLEGSPDDVRRAALERLRLAAPGGAYILSTACSVAPKTPAANIMALGEAVDEYVREDGTGAD